MGISVGGIVSGIDTDDMIAKLVAAARIPQTVIASRLAHTEKQKAAYESLSSKLTDLTDALEAIDTADELNATTATSSDDTTVAITATGAAIPGRYSITVTALAAESVSISDGFADSSTDGTVAEGTFDVTYAGTTTTLTLDSTNSSLQGMVDEINANVAGVTAYIMNTGDAATPYRLVITGDDTGAENTLTIDTSGLTGAGDVPTFTETSTAQDATLTVNGIDITSASNDVDGVIEGMTFNLNDITSSAVTITVKSDTATTIANVQAFVDAYNEVRTYINTNRAYDAEAEIKGEFRGESTVSALMARFDSVLGDVYTTGATFQTLTSLGITTEDDGTLTLDEDVLTEALDTDAAEVAALFETDAEGIGDTLKALIELYNNEDASTISGGVVTVGGLLTDRIAAIDEQIVSLEDDLDRFDVRMDAYEARLKKQFTAMELALAKLQDAQGRLVALMPTTTQS